MRQTIIIFVSMLRALCIKDVTTLLGLQSVVGPGSTAGAALCAAVQPVDLAGALVAAAMALEGAEPGHRARLLHVGHVVDGDAAVEAGPNRFEYQLEGSKEGRRKKDFLVKFVGAVMIGLLF